MEKITLQIKGMACGMCEAHINDALRQNFAVKKVSSSHKKGETVMIVKDPPEEERLRAVIAQTGYELCGIERQPYEKKGLFGRG